MPGLSRSLWFNFSWGVKGFEGREEYGEVAVKLITLKSMSVL